jgi:hypothetical protein
VSRSGLADAVPARALTPRLRPSAVLPRDFARRRSYLEPPPVGGLTSSLRPSASWPRPPAPVGFRLPASRSSLSGRACRLRPSAAAFRLRARRLAPVSPYPRKGLCGRLRPTAGALGTCVLDPPTADVIRCGRSAPWERPYSLACPDVSGCADVSGAEYQLGRLASGIPKAVRAIS